MTQRDAFLEKVDEQWARLMAAVGSVPPGRISEPGVSGEWSVKDIVGHVATWDRLMLGVLQGDEQARRSAATSLDTFNAAESRRKRRFSVEKALRELEATHAALRDMLDASPAEVFALGHPWRKALDDDTHLHHAEHGADILRWLESSGRRAGTGTQSPAS